jgi:hypothetical protein
VDASSADLGHGRRPARLIKSLLLKVGLSATGSAALVSTVAGNT